VGEIGLCLDFGTTLFVRDIVGKVFFNILPEQNRTREKKVVVVRSKFELSWFKKITGYNSIHILGIN